ncbi:uncharacterized protein [Typha latifolia]|uniref:uncharacterized protein n=1 Tax=Typha latifolia TaxID=4733 RepID=UPI003C3007DF
MDRFLKQYDRESARHTILKHEEIFRQQVHELHRIYRVQKMLMAEFSNKHGILHSVSDVTHRLATSSRPEFWTSAATSKTSHVSHISPLVISEYHNLHLYSASICSEDPWVARKSFDLQHRADDEFTSILEDNQDQTSVSRNHLKEKMCKEGSEFCTDSKSEIDLTLSIGYGEDKNKSKCWLR